MVQLRHGARDLRGVGQHTQLRDQRAEAVRAASSLWCQEGCVEGHRTTAATARRGPGSAAGADVRPTTKAQGTQEACLHAHPFQKVPTQLAHSVWYRRIATVQRTTQTNFIFMTTLTRGREQNTNTQANTLNISCARSYTIIYLSLIYCIYFHTNRNIDTTVQYRGCSPRESTDNTTTWSSWLTALLPSLNGIAHNAGALSDEARPRTAQRGRDGPTAYIRNVGRLSGEGRTVQPRYTYNAQICLSGCQRRVRASCWAPCRS